MAPLNLHLPPKLAGISSIENIYVFIVHSITLSSQRAKITYQEKEINLLRNFLLGLDEMRTDSKSLSTVMSSLENAVRNMPLCLIQRTANLTSEHFRKFPSYCMQERDERNILELRADPPLL